MIKLSFICTFFAILSALPVSGQLKQLETSFGPGRDSTNSSTIYKGSAADIPLWGSQSDIIINRETATDKVMQWVCTMSGDGVVDTAVWEAVRMVSRMTSSGISTDLAGEFTITHSLGRAPRIIACNSQTAGQICMISETTTTTIRGVLINSLLSPLASLTDLILILDYY